MIYRYRKKNTYFDLANYTLKRCVPSISPIATTFMRLLDSRTTWKTLFVQTGRRRCRRWGDINVFGFGPSRLPPRFFMALISARHAIREEFSGLLRKSTGGLPALQIVGYSSYRFRSIPRLRTTLLVKLRAGSKMKARLVPRGAQEPILQPNFASSPPSVVIY